MHKQHTNCRCCGSENMEIYLNLGMMPMANNLLPTFDEALAAPRFPLEVMYCHDCSLSQLSVVVDPQVLFGNYVYRSSINTGYVSHCREMAQTMNLKYNLTSESFMIDIAGNDGALLAQFKDEIGLKVLNIDPAVNMAAINEAKGIRVLTEFWGTDCARRLTGFGKADLITATNVFAHVDDVRDFLLAAKMVLKESGVLVLEFPYLVDFIEKNEFDTVYFEHLSYFSIAPLVKLGRECELYVNEVEKFSIHGGSVRVTLSLTEKQHPSVAQFINMEVLKGFTSFYRYANYAETCEKATSLFREGLNNINFPTEKVAAFAASAKGNTLLCHAHNTYPITYIVDETPEKIGKYTPGCAKPIVSIIDMMQSPPDYLIILSWNFADEIMTKCRANGYVGKFVIPIPEWKVIS